MRMPVYKAVVEEKGTKGDGGETWCGSPGRLSGKKCRKIGQVADWLQKHPLRLKQTVDTTTPPRSHPTAADLGNAGSEIFLGQKKTKLVSK